MIEGVDEPPLCLEVVRLWGGESLVVDGRPAVELEHIVGEDTATE